MEIIIAPGANIELSISDFDTCPSGVIIDDDVIIISLPFVACVEITITDDNTITIELIDSLAFLSFPPPNWK